MMKRTINGLILCASVLGAPVARADAASVAAITSTCADWMATRDHSTDEAMANLYLFGVINGYIYSTAANGQAMKGMPHNYLAMINQVTAFCSDKPADKWQLIAVNYLKSFVGR